MASRAVALSYAARRLRGNHALQRVSSRAPLPRSWTDDQLELGTTRAQILYGPPLGRTGPVTEQEALGNSFFGRGVALLANALAGTQWFARKLDPATGVRVPLAEQPNIVTDPSPLQTLWNYRWAAAEDGILYGNHFGLCGELDWRTGRPGWIIPIAADQVWILTDPAAPGWFQWVIGGETFDPDEIFHVSYGARSGEILGRGVLQQYADSLGGIQAAEEYARETFEAGILPPAIITVPANAGDDNITKFKEQWRDTVRTREPIVFRNGTVLTPVVGNAQQAQLVEAREWNAQVVANAVGVPGWKLGLDGPTMTYQNVESGDIDFVRDSVDRYGRPLTEAIGKWLLPAGTELVWDYDSRMRADQKTTAEVLTTYVDAGVLTKDEARARLNRPPLPATAEPPAPPPAADNTTAHVDDAVDAASDLSPVGAS